MGSTYVNNLRLEEMTTGEKSGTWGNITNVNLELVGQALGYGTRAIADASTDNITIADGASDADRSMYLKLTGGGQACTITLLPNTSSKMWIMENATSYTLTFSQGTGANVAIKAGQTKMIFADGLGGGAVVYELGTVAVQNIQADGTVTVGIDDTGYDVTFFGATTGKKLFWDQSEDTLNVAGTTALAGNLSVTGITSNADGSAAAPSITNTGDVNSGLYFPAADTLGVTLAGALDFKFEANDFTAMSGSVISTNTINETTAASGVTIDGALVKDGAITFGSGSGALGYYQEGTFTPGILAGTTDIASSDGTGIYTRTGNVVYVQMILRVNRGTTTGVLSVTGLPYTVIASTNAQPSWLVYDNADAYNGGRMPGLIFGANQTIINFYSQPTLTSASLGGLNASEMFKASSQSYINISGSYIVA